jgi:nitrogen fixation-related uncharacterized protein
MIDFLIFVGSVVVLVWLVSFFWSIDAEKREEELRRERDEEIFIELEEQRARGKKQTLESLYWQNEGEIDRIVGRERNYYE